MGKPRFYAAQEWVKRPDWYPRSSWPKKLGLGGVFTALVLAILASSVSWAQPLPGYVRKTSSFIYRNCTLDESTGQMTGCVSAGSGDVTDVFDCASGNCADVTMGATDSLDASAIDGDGTGEGIILPQTTTCSSTNADVGSICYSTTGDAICVYDGAAYDCQTLGVTDTDTTCNDAGVTCNFAASSSEGGNATNADNLEGVDLGTLTDGKVCTYDQTNTEIDCNTTPGSASAINQDADGNNEFSCNGTTCCIDADDNGTCEITFGTTGITDYPRASTACWTFGDSDTDDTDDNCQVCTDCPKPRCDTNADCAAGTCSGNACTADTGSEDCHITLECQRDGAMTTLYDSNGGVTVSHVVEGARNSTYGTTAADGTCMCFRANVPGGINDLDEVYVGIGTADADDTAELGVYSVDGSKQYFEGSMTVTGAGAVVVTNDFATPDAIRPNQPVMICVSRGDGGNTTAYALQTFSGGLGGHYRDTSQTCTSGEMPSTQTTGLSWVWSTTYSPVFVFVDRD